MFSSFCSQNPELDIPILFVTHDLVEALLLAEQMAVIDNGRVLQLDTPERIRERPVNALTAELVGA